MASVRLQLPPDPRWLAVLRSTVMALVPSTPLDRIDDLALAIGEAAAEVTVVGSSQPLEVELDVNQDSIRAMVHGGHDEGWPSARWDQGLPSRILQRLANSVEADAHQGRRRLRLDLSLSRPT